MILGGVEAGGTKFVCPVGVGGGRILAERRIPTRGPRVHPELGHVDVPRAPGDDFSGVRPFHADCVEGMASGPAIAARWGVPAEDLHGALRERAVELEAVYLASGIRTLVYAVAPSGSCSAAGWPACPGCCRACARTCEWRSAGIRACPSTPTRPSCRRRPSGRWPGPLGRS